MNNLLLKMSNQDLEGFVMDQMATIVVLIMVILILGAFILGLIVAKRL